MRGVSPVTIRTEVSRFGEDLTTRRTPRVPAANGLISEVVWRSTTQFSMGVEWIRQIYQPRREGFAQRSAHAQRAAPPAHESDSYGTGADFIESGLLATLFLDDGVAQRLV